MQQQQQQQQRKMREVPPYREPPGLGSLPLPRTLPPYRDPPPPNLSSPSRSQFSPLPSSGSPRLQNDQEQKSPSPNSNNNSTVKLKRNLFQVDILYLLGMKYENELKFSQGTFSDGKLWYVYIYNRYSNMLLFR